MAGKLKRVIITRKVLYEFVIRDPAEAYPGMDEDAIKEFEGVNADLDARKQKVLDDIEFVDAEAIVGASVYLKFKYEEEEKSSDSQ